jgi:hypothetical protein
MDGIPLSLSGPLTFSPDIAQQFLVTISKVKAIGHSPFSAGSSLKSPILDN